MSYKTCIDCECEISGCALRCKKCEYRNRRKENGTPLKPELKKQFRKGFAFCRDCQQFLPIERFSKGPQKNLYLSYYCKACEKTQNQKRKDYQKEYFKHRTATTKKQYVDMMGGQCQNCGYNTFLASLHFHHIDPTEKETGLSTILYNGNNTEQILIELDKCCLLCANCHSAIRTGELDPPFIKNDGLGWTIK